MIRLDLEPEQRRTARSGYIDISPEQIRRVWSRYTSSQRTTHGGGRKPSCSCDQPTCAVCRHREAQRRYRAKKEEESK